MAARGSKKQRGGVTVAVNAGRTLGLQYCRFWQAGDDVSPAPVRNLRELFAAAGVLPQDGASYKITISRLPNGGQTCDTR